MLSFCIAKRTMGINEAIKHPVKMPFRDILFKFEVLKVSLTLLCSCTRYHGMWFGQKENGITGFFESGRAVKIDDDDDDQGTRSLFNRKKSHCLFACSQYRDLNKCLVYQHVTCHVNLQSCSLMA